MTALRRSANRGYFASQRFEDVYYLPPRQWMRPMSLSYGEAVADLLYIRGLIYYGEGFQHHLALRHVADYVEAILAVDPDFVAAYHWATLAVAYQTQTAPVEDLVRVSRLMAQGAERFPNSGDMAWWTGSFYAYELAPRLALGSDARREASATGYSHLARAAQLGAGPRWLALSNASQLIRMGQRSHAISHLENMMALTGDPELKRQIAARLRVLRSAEEAEATTHAARAAERQWVENYPYLDVDLFELVGPRSVLDGVALPPALPSGSVGAP